MSEPSTRVLLVGGLTDIPLSQEQQFQEQLRTSGSGLLEVECVWGLDQAFLRSEAEWFDVLLLNAVPDMARLDAVAKMRHNGDQTPVVWLSGCGEDWLAKLSDSPSGLIVENRDNPEAVVRAVRFACTHERSRGLLLQREERFRIACEASRSMVYDIDANTGRARFVHGIQDLLGYDAWNGAQPEDWWFSLIHPSDLAEMRSQLNLARSRGEDYSIQYRVRHRNGTYIIVEDSGRIIVDPREDSVRSVGKIVDITPRVRAAEALQESERNHYAVTKELELLVEARTADLSNLNRILEMITECSKAIVRASSETALLDDICRIIVKSGGYRVAWIRSVRQDAADIVPVVWAGDPGVCPAQKGTCRKGEGIDLVEEAIKSGKALIGCSWQQEFGCVMNSSLALPLIQDKEIFGALIICSFTAEAFDDVRVPILQELADDLAFGLAALRTRAQLGKALEDLGWRSEQLRTLASELTQAEERERKRLAQAMHDDLQQILVAAKFNADTIAKGAANTSLREAAEQLNGFLRQAIESTRSLSFDLCPPVLQEAGLCQAFWFLSRRMESRHGLSVSIQVDEAAEPEIEEVRVVLFQCVRELLFNVVKHAGVRAAKVEMRRLKKDYVQITVSDCGIGFDPETKNSKASQNGFGLFNVRGRLELIGGSLDIRSIPGVGSRFTIRAPIRKTVVSKPSDGEDNPATLPLPRSRGGLLRAGRRVQEGNPGKPK